ncbi:hypothetical protein DMB90_12010 [Raoultella planticola]|uniref:Uncharacterized protein n=1 Tax=Raoultella planticola TaxID=575 RepID=A0A5P6AAR3_RAOPL|nr:hypothetical protein DMB90_12010 [Raoultella planticola]
MCRNQASPIIIDLDGDGIETLSVSSGVFFDHDGNQFAENTGWVAPDDGLLIFDRDGNGQIDSGSELFGNNTLLKSGKLAANGYQALQELDENKDGQLNSDDAIWASLRIWQDGNSNGRVDEGELLSLKKPVWPPLAPATARHNMLMNRECPPANQHHYAFRWRCRPIGGRLVCGQQRILTLHRRCDPVR